MDGAGTARALLLGFVLAFGSASAGLAAGALPRLNLVAGGLTVSGISSGGYMATQYQVAYSKDVTGAGIIAAGPWFCAQGVLTTALRECLEGKPDGPDDRALVAMLRASAKTGVVDDPSWLAPDRIWILHGARDRTVGAAVTDSLVRFYRAFVPIERIYYETRIESGHGFPTDGQGVPCEATESPWINDCGFDAAGSMLGHLYEGLREPGGGIGGELIEFDQARYLTGGMLASLEGSGLVFVPKDCAAGKPCRLHVAFHGCRQGIGFVGRDFARNTGYLRWAEANRIVVLYPQVARSLLWPYNPKGCWDWWGYSGANYASRDGLQLRAVRRMIEALGYSGT